MQAYWKPCKHFKGHLKPWCLSNISDYVKELNIHPNTMVVWVLPDHIHLKTEHDSTTCTSPNLSLFTSPAGRLLEGGVECSKGEGTRSLFNASFLNKIQNLLNLTAVWAARELMHQGGVSPLGFLFIGTRLFLVFVIVFLFFFSLQGISGFLSVFVIEFLTWVYV